MDKDQVASMMQAGGFTNNLPGFVKQELGDWSFSAGATGSPQTICPDWIGQQVACIAKIFPGRVVIDASGGVTVDGYFAGTNPGGPVPGQSLLDPTAIDAGVCTQLGGSMGGDGNCVFLHNSTTNPPPQTQPGTGAAQFSPPPASSIVTNTPGASSNAAAASGGTQTGSTAPSFDFSSIPTWGWVAIGAAALFMLGGKR